MKKLSFIALLAIFTAFIVGCTPVAGLFQREIVLTDDFDRQIILQKPAERIVSLVPSNTEMLFALGLADKIVGVTEFCNYPSEVSTKTKVGGFGAPSVEKIVSVSPDLVVSASLHQSVVEQLAQLNIAVIALNPRTISDIMDNARLLGRATGTSRRAETLIQEMTNTLRQVDEKTKSVADADRPLVYFEIWHDPITSAGPNTFVHELITRGGGKNMAAEAATDWPSLSLEDVLARQPQVLLRGHGMQTVQEVLARPNWGTVPAIAEGRVYLVNDDLVLRPGPRIVQGLLEIARALHPELWR